MDLFQIDTVGERSLYNEDRNKNIERTYFESKSLTEDAGNGNHTSNVNNDNKDIENEYDYFGEWSLLNNFRINW